jgi:flavin-binding protein dodecin
MLIARASGAPDRSAARESCCAQRRLRSNKWKLLHEPDLRYSAGRGAQARLEQKRCRDLQEVSRPAIVAHEEAIKRRSMRMAESVYRVTELVGVSSESWEAAARNAVETAAKTLRSLRVAEAHRFDVTIEDGKVTSYRVRLDVSFKYEPSA